MTETIKLLEAQVECLKRLCDIAEDQRKTELKARVAADQWVQNLLEQIKQLQDEKTGKLGQLYQCHECSKVRLLRDACPHCGAVGFKMLDLIK